MLKYIETNDIKYKGKLFKGRRIIGLEEMLAKIYPLRKKAIFVEGWRTKEKQAEYVKKGTSWTMDSNHRRGAAFDIWNWAEMEPEMKKLGFINDLKPNDPGHFTLGGEEKTRKNYKIIDKLPDNLEKYKPKKTPKSKVKVEIVQSTTVEEKPQEGAKIESTIDYNIIKEEIMETQAQKTVKRFSWQGASMVLTAIGGILASQEVRELVALYPEALAGLAVVSLVVMNLTKIVNSYLQFKKEMEKFN